MQDYDSKYEVHYVSSSFFGKLINTMEFFLLIKWIKSLSGGLISNFLIHIFSHNHIIFIFWNKRFSFNSCVNISIIISRFASLHLSCLKFNSSLNNVLMIGQSFDLHKKVYLDSSKFWVDEAASGVFHIGHFSWFHFSWALFRIIKHPTLETKIKWNTILLSIQVLNDLLRCIYRFKRTILWIKKFTTERNIVANVTISGSSTNLMFFFVMILTGR